MVRYGKPLLPKVMQFSKPVKNTTLHIEIFIQLVQFSIQGIQFHTFPIAISTRNSNLDENSTRFIKTRRKLDEMEKSRRKLDEILCTTGSNPFLFYISLGKEPGYEFDDTCEGKSKRENQLNKFGGPFLKTLFFTLWT